MLKVVNIKMLIMSEYKITEYFYTGYELTNSTSSYKFTQKSSENINSTRNLVVEANEQDAEQIGDSEPDEVPPDNSVSGNGIL